MPPLIFCSIVVVVVVAESCMPATDRCVPYRANKKDDEAGGNPCSSLGDGDDTADVEVLMISTPNRSDMVFPKVRTYVKKAKAAASSAHKH